MLQGSSLDQFEEIFVKIEVDSFCERVFGKKYSEIKSVIYPEPTYRAFQIKKRSGGNRLILEPRKRVKALQNAALDYLQNIDSKAKACVHGFVANRSIVTNAEAHLTTGQPTFLLNIDLEDFFPSITFRRVRGVFMNAPFGFSYSVATVLAHLCTYKNALPQGAPTSPYISNLICRGLDRDLMALAKRHRAKYTRYADDLTFSFSVREESRLPTSICIYDGGVVSIGEELSQIINGHTFKINAKKTRISTKYRRQEVTGITINEFPNLRRQFVDRIRGALHAWEKYGYDAAEGKWQEMVEATKGSENSAWRRQTRTNSPPRLENLLWGRLLYVRMVRGAEDSIYTRLAERFNKLVKARGGSAALPVSYVVKNQQDVSRATFVIEVAGDAPKPNSNETDFVCAQGTAFSYKRADIIITCAHLFTMQMEHQGKVVDVEYEAIKDACEITLHLPGSTQNWKAKLIVRDNDRDLAILQIVGDITGLRYFSPLATQGKRHQPCWLMGFPNWNPGRLLDRYPTQISNRFARTGLDRFEVIQAIRKGNSGGPLTDDSFRILGIAQQGATQERGNNECLCVGEIEKWLSSTAVPIQI